MKNLLILVGLITSLTASSQTDRHIQLQNLLKKKAYFLLRDSFNKTQAKLNVSDRLYYKAYIDNAFNKCKSSATEVNDLLIAHHHNNLNDNLIAGLLALQIDNYAKTYQYKAAAKYGKSMLRNYKSVLDSARIDDIRNSNIIWSALAAIPPQQVIKRSDTHLKWRRDQANLINIPATVSGIQSDFIFDTGANLSTISASYAKKLHLQILKTSFNLGSGTSISNKASLAIAAKVFIGHIELRNVVFLVLPDDQLNFPQIKYSIHGIVGFPVISQLGEIHIRKNRTMFLPKNQVMNMANNLAIDELTPIINLKTDKDSLMFTFDTGAKLTELSSLYYNRYQTEIEGLAKPDSISRASAGGAVRAKVYKLPSFNIYMDENKIEIGPVDVLTTADNDKDQFYYGNIGQDFISKFDEMILNFNHMYISFK